MWVPATANLWIRESDIQIPRGINSPTVGLRMGTIAQFDQQCALPNIGGYALKSERLEAGPFEQCSVGGGEFSEILGEVLVCVCGANRLLRGT
jgi:hypothetical protein